MVYEYYRGYALKIVFRYIYRYEKAVEVVNDGFVKLFKYFDKFELVNDADNEKLLLAWMKKIMINVSIDQLRRDEMTPEIGEIPGYAWELPNDQNADQVLLYNDLIALIKKLPPSYRLVFNLYVIDGYSHVEIAEILKIPIGTSRANLSRARLLLEKNIRKIEEAHICRI